AQKWSGVEKQPTVLAENLVAGLKTRVAKRNGDLKGLATFEGLPSNSQAVQSWVERAKTMRGDLPGFWNDHKSDLADRIGAKNSPADQRLKRALDMLEVAEGSGGLGSRLEQWNEMLKKGFDWGMVDEASAEITNGIAFCRSVVKETFGDLAPNDPSLRDRTD